MSNGLVMGNGCYSKRPNLINHRSSVKSRVNIKSIMAPNNVEFSNGHGGSDIKVESVLQDDVKNVNVMRREFQDNVDVFLLNNILMAVQFFEDHKDAGYLFNEDTPLKTTKENFLANSKNTNRFINPLYEKLFENNEGSQEESDADRLIVQSALDCTIEESNVNSFRHIAVAEDIEVLVLLISLSSDDKEIYFLKPSQNNDLQKIYSTKFSLKKISNVRKEHLLFIHAFTGCDTASAFCRKNVKDDKKLHDAAATFMSENQDEDQLFNADASMMGNGCPKTSHRISHRIKSTSMRRIDGLDLGDNDVTVESIQRDDLIIIDIIRRELDEHVPVFLLNNMIMAVQFFADHRDVITRLQHVSASPQEKEMNKTLLKDETMECTYPDVIMEEVNKNLIFRTVEEHSSSENLVPKRIYVINDLIEVVTSKDVPQYTSIDKPLYQVRIEECDRKGFVKLLQIENNTPILSSREFVENYEPLPGPSSRSDSEYGYLTITALRTPKPIEVDSSIERRDTLPEPCFSHRKIKKYPMIELDDSDEDEESKLEYLANLDEDDLYKEVTYINSNGFMRYFQNTLFPMSLGKSLGLNEDAIVMAKAMPGKVFCDDLDIETNIVRTYQIIPAVAIPWPDDQTIEFVLREDRPTIIDRRTGIKYRWPSNGPGGMMEEITNMTAVLVPKGYAKKRGVNRDANLEWEINFPKAERYLEVRMSHAQMKCFLLLLTIHKTYIAPVTEQNGLLPEHIRTHMYWECETDYRNWPEHRLGTKILKVIEDLKHRLFLGSLPDFFIKDKDLFENIPKKYLLYAQKILLAILDNPVPYFIKALRNLRYTSGKFYPPLNFKELYESLTTKKSAELVNPNLGVQRTFRKKRIYKDADQQIKYLKDTKVKEKIIMQRKKEKEDELNAKAKEEMLKKMRDEIDLDAPMEKKLDFWKTKPILVMFIKNFIDIAKKSATLATTNQVLFYLKQAFYLTKILEEQSPSFLDEIREFRETIAAEETRIKKITLRSPSTSEEKPPTPVRNSVSFQFNDITVTQQMKQGSIKLNNLHASYMNGLQAPAPMRNLKPATVQRSESYKQNGATKRKTVAFVT